MEDKRMTHAAQLEVLGLCGSLRKKSFNAMALRAVEGLLPPGMVLDRFDDLRSIPPYDDDVRVEGFPPAVQALRARIAAADAILFVSPEYNYSVPGVLKNAIDWASRGPDQPFDGKPVAIMGASPGMIGTARMQYHLRQICVFLNMVAVPRPEVMIGQAATRFDEEGRLTDEGTRERIRALLVALAELTRKLRC
jgi:chromate reductase, NAD(P)H dehydrogenase (quinone)